LGPRKVLKAFFKDQKILQEFNRFFNEKAIKLWEEFFQNTTTLPEPLFYKAKGQELHI